jgi:hypothetical protein
VLHTYACGHCFNIGFTFLPLLWCSPHTWPLPPLCWRIPLRGICTQKVVFALRIFFWKNMEQENVKKTGLFAVVGILSLQSANTIIMPTCCSSLCHSSLCVAGKEGFKNLNSSFCISAHGLRNFKFLFVKEIQIKVSACFYEITY